jgi:hypothetical protein
MRRLAFPARAVAEMDLGEVIKEYTWLAESNT